MIKHLTKDRMGCNAHDFIGGLTIISIAALIAFGIGSCISNQNKEYKKQDMFFNGPHKLYCFGAKNESSGNISGSTFLGFGSFRGEMKNTESIKFIWQHKLTDELFPTSLPINRVRFCMIQDSDSTEPFVEFSWYNEPDFSGFNSRWVELISYCIIHLKQDQLDSRKYIKFDTN